MYLYNFLNVIYYLYERSDFMNLKIERLNNLIMREVSMIIQTEVKDRDIRFVTITAVKTTSDLSYSKIYVTMLADDRRKEIMKALNNASGFIRKELANRINVRHIPKLDFVFDESIEYGNRIENKIREIHENDEK